jgi:hypothetical protein
VTIGVLFIDLGASLQYSDNIKVTLAAAAMTAFVPSASLVDFGLGLCQNLYNFWCVLRKPWQSRA